MTTFLRVFVLFIEALQTKKKHYLIGGCGLENEDEEKRTKAKELLYWSKDSVSTKIYPFVM